MNPPSKGRGDAIAVVAVIAILSAFVWWEKHRFTLTVRNYIEGETIHDVQLTLGYDKASVGTLEPGETATLTDLRLAGDTPLQLMFTLGKQRCLQENESVVRERGYRIEIELRSCFTGRSRSGAWPSVWTTSWKKSESP